MPTQHLAARLALRATGTIPVPAHPRWILVAFIVAVVILVLEHKAHAPHAPVALAAVPFGQAWKAWREELVARELHRNTIRQYRTRCFAWVGWLTHPPRGRHRKDWWQASKDDFAAFQRRPAPPRPGQHAGRRVAPNTRAAYQATIPPMYDWCYGQGLIDHNPLAGLRPPRKPEPSEQPLDLAQVAKLLHYTRTHPDRRLEVLVALCYGEGLRSGEPAHLDVGDVDLDATDPRIKVLGKGRRSKEWFALKAAVIPILQDHLRWLAERYDLDDWHQLPAGTPLLQHAQQLGVPISPRRTCHLLAQAMRDAQVPGRPHDLRRTAANQVAESYQDNPGPLRAFLRHRGYGALDAYRQPSVHKLGEYVASITWPDTWPDPLAERSDAGR